MNMCLCARFVVFFFSSRRRHTRFDCDWSSDVCSSDLNLLFERFLHEEMTSTPDIDIDFSTAHREQVIQYIYEKYGWERTGMVCNVVTFQPRMAIRQVGKALGFSAELLHRLAKGVDRRVTED